MCLPAPRHSAGALSLGRYMTSTTHVDDDEIGEIDRAIVYARSTPGLDPAIRNVFIDALLDKRSAAQARRP